MDEDATADGGVRFDGEPHDPLSHRSGAVHELLAELSDDELAEYCRNWAWRCDQYRAEGHGFNAWKSSNQLSAGYREVERRGLDAGDLRSRIEEDLATRPEDFG